MNWNPAPMAWLLWLGFLTVLVSSRHNPHEPKNHIPMPPLWVFLGLNQPSLEDTVKEHSSWAAVGTKISTPPQSTSGSTSTSRVQRPATVGSLPSVNPESGQLSPTVPLVWPSGSDHPASFRSSGSSTSATSELAPSGPVELAITKTTTKPGTTSIAVASVSGPMEQLSISESPRVISSPSSLDPRQPMDGLMSNETSSTGRYANSLSFLIGLELHRPEANMSKAPGEPTTSESNTSGLARQPAGISPSLTIIPASSVETKGPTSTQASTSVSPVMEGPVVTGHPPALSSDTAEASTSLYLTLAPSDLGDAISTATLESDTFKPASITLASAELSSPVVPELPVLVFLHPKETEAPTPEPSGQTEYEPPPTGGALPLLIQDTHPLNDATVSSMGSGSRGPSTLSSLSMLSPPSPTPHSPSPPPSSLSLSPSLLPSSPMLVLSTTQSTTSGSPRDPSIPTSISTSIESTTNTSSLQFSHQSAHQEGLELTTSRVLPSGSTPITASSGANTFGLAVTSDATSVVDSSPTSLVSLENFSSISSPVLSSTTPNIHLTATPTITPYLSWSHPSMNESMDSAWSPTSVGAELSMPSASSPPAQYPSLLDSVPPSQGCNYVTRPLTFKITNEIFTAAFYDPTSLEYRLLSENVQNQLTLIYQRAFSSFVRVEVNGFRLGSVVANTTIVFGNETQAPSPMDIVWVLYREVKAVGMMLGNLSLAENTIQSEASTLTTLAPLTVHISLTTMEPFVSSHLRPGSATYTTLERQTIGPVTLVVLGFYGMYPQEPLLLFSNDDQWVGVTIVYKFNVPIPAGLRGLADHLAHEVTNTHIQKSSISVNEEKAELTVYNLCLRIHSCSFTEALKDKASKESRDLRGRLTRGLTTILRHTRNFAEVIVEEFLPSPMMARVRPTYFSAAPSEADVQKWVYQGLATIKDAENLYVELASPDFDLPSSRLFFPGYAIAMIILGLLLLLGIPLVLILTFKTNMCSQIPGRCVWKSHYGRQVTESEYTMHSYDLKH